MDFSAKDLLTDDAESPDKEPEAVEAVPTQDGATTVISVPSDKASSIHVGDSFSASVSGKVKSVRDNSTDDQESKMIDVELSGPTVSSIQLTPADYELKRMSEN